MPPWGFDDIREESSDDREKASDAARIDRQRAVRLIMSDESGRAWLREIIQFCGVFQAITPSDALHMAFREGMRNCGLRIYGDLEYNAPDLLAILNSEGGDKSNV